MALTSGSQVGPYEVRSPLGAGGMGEVYRAHDTKLGRDVALKVLPEVVARDPERMARFKREAQVLASLNHPNIAAIYGFEESGATRALVMELVEGQTLAEVVGARRTVPVAEALPLAKQISEALEYAHERGIVHRDLKPANIKVTPEGMVKVLDFGLAKALDTEASTGSDASNSPTLTAAATQAGVIIGTAAYMSPEQARGKAVDRKADIWSFGCVLYEMLAGRRTFEGETVSDTLAAVLKSEPDWTALPAKTPPRIRELIRRCLAKDTKQRLQAIGEARITLEETISGVGAGLETRPYEIGGETPLQPARRSTLPWALAGVLAVALMAVVLSWKFATPVRQSSVRFTAITNFAGVQAQPAISPDGRSVAFVSNRDGHYNIYVGLIGGGSLVQITSNPNLKEWPRWTPDGTKLAFSQLNDSGTTDIWEVPALGGTPRRLILNSKDPDWSRDGGLLAYQNVTDGGIWVSDPSGQNTRQVIPGPGYGYSNTEPRFSPTGRELAFVARSPGPYGELRIADVTSGKVRQMTHDNALVLSPAWSPDGRSIYFASSRGGTMNIWKIAETGGEPQQITTGQGDDAELDVSADGTRIVFSTFRDNLHIVQLDVEAKSGQPDLKPLTTDPARNQIAPAYSPDGKRLAYFTNRKGAEKESVWIADADGSNPVPVAQDSLLNIFPHWTPDGEHLIFNSKEHGFENSSLNYRLISTSGGAPQTILNVGPDNLFDVGPQGRLLYRGLDGKAQSYDPSSNKAETPDIHPPGANWWMIRWSRGGNSMGYIVSATRENDPNAGLWVDDTKNPPHQVFRGWVLGYARGPGDKIFLLEGRADMTGIIWMVDWDGKGLTRTSATVPLISSFWTQMPKYPQQYFDPSPDGRHLAVNVQGVLQANIGMIENAR